MEATSVYAADVVVDSLTPRTLYAQASRKSGEGILKSVEGGATWSFGLLRKEKYNLPHLRRAVPAIGVTAPGGAAILVGTWSFGGRTVQMVQ